MTDVAIETGEKLENGEVVQSPDDNGQFVTQVHVSEVAGKSENTLSDKINTEEISENKSTESNSEEKRSVPNDKSDDSVHENDNTDEQTKDNISHDDNAVEPNGIAVQIESDTADEIENSHEGHDTAEIEENRNVKNESKGRDRIDIDKKEKPTGDHTTSLPSYPNLPTQIENHRNDSSKSPAK